MTRKLRHKLFKLSSRHTFLSTRAMWFGVFLGVFAWIMQFMPLAAPIWSSNLSLGHGVCIKLAPVIETARQADAHKIHVGHQDAHINHQNHAHHNHAASNSILAINTNNSTPDPDIGQHSACDICTVMAAYITPIVVTNVESQVVELHSLSAQVFYKSYRLRSPLFLRPLSRAPPNTQG